MVKRMIPHIMKNAVKINIILSKLRRRDKTKSKIMELSLLYYSDNEHPIPCRSLAEKIGLSKTATHHHIVKLREFYPNLAFIFSTQ